MTRHGFVIGLRPEAEDEYRELHAATWPAVKAQIKRSNITNYSIFLHGGLLFGYFEYVGDDLEADMAAMAQPRRGGVVGGDGRGLPPRLTPRRVRAGAARRRRRAR
jgi:hypothetical protein